MLQGSGGEQAFWLWVVAAGAAFLAVFMAKVLVFNKRAERDTRALELTPAEQPALFAFLYRLADDAGAPRPHKVYLSAQVNAGVFYDLSLINLLLPSRKNLDIGLGLVNVLNLGELKAVLAHEFGHFAKRTMAVGRWVYIAQQIAAHIVGKRDALDRVLATLSRIDLRVAWIGWGLSLIVWSIRSLVEITFRGVVLAQRALAREMEYQTDLVAASLTGSDALVHALHKLEAADDGFQRALRFAAHEFAQDRPVKDLFAIQSRIIEHMRVVLNDPAHGAVPAVPTDAAQLHRLFHSDIAQPSQMWATHPPSAAREENLKRRYIACPIDARPAMELLHDAQAQDIFSEPPQKVSGKGGQYRDVLTAVSGRSPRELLGELGSERDLALITAHARWDDADSAYLEQWMEQLRRAAPQAVPALVAERLQRNPHDVVALRMQQDIATPEQRVQVCRQQTAAAQAHPDASELQYAAIRCRSDTPERYHAFVATQARWPNDPWLQRAAAAVQVGQLHLPQAQALYEQAARTPALTDEVLPLLARLQRYRGLATDLPGMAQQSPSLASIVALEGGERTKGTPYRSYYALAHGQLDTAVTEAAADADVQARIVRLAAASRGASAALLQRARVLPERAGLDPITAPSAWALAARQGWQTDALRAATLQGTGEDGAYIARFFDAVQAGSSQQQAEAALSGVERRQPGRPRPGLHDGGRTAGPALPGGMAAWCPAVVVCQ